MVSYLAKHPKSNSRELIYDSRFKIDINPYGSSPSPEKAIYFDQNTCVNENPESKSIDNLDAETCGERLIRNELRPGHWSVLNFADVTLRCFNFPHSVIAQLTRHHEQKFLVQSGRYTGKRFMEWDGSLAGVEDLVYLRPTGCYTTRSGDRYVYDEKSRQGDLELLQVVLKHYQKRVQEGMPYEQARGCMAYDFRQSFSIRGSIKNWFHLLDQRTLADSQLEAQSFAYMALEVLRGYSPSLFDFYFNNRAGKNKLAP